MDPVKIYDLNQVAYLDTEGLRYDRTEGSGRNVSFVFDTLTPEQASALFARPEFDLCRRFRRAWVEVRRAIERANGEAAP